MALPRRSKRYGVGKEIRGAIYLHRLYENRLGTVVAEAARSLPKGFSYDVVKYKSREETVSFIQVPGFDHEPEPTIGEIVVVYTDGRTRRRPQSNNPEIYHHKWLFVLDDYPGFDVDDAKKRSADWMSLDDVDRKRIGRSEYWHRVVVPRLSKPDS